MNTVTAGTPLLSPHQSKGRVINLVASLLEKHLTVPEIYLQPTFVGISSIDILAVDHAGGGDIHGVNVVCSSGQNLSRDLEHTIEEGVSMPAHYRYVAIQSDLDPEHAKLRQALLGTAGFDEDGLGRIALIEYPAALLRPESALVHVEPAKLLNVPERYVVRGGQIRAIEKFVEQTVPDIRVRI